MGTVYKATQLSMDRTIALKVLKQELSQNREFARGFLKEARVAGQLTHPALVQVHDFGEAGGVLYFSMEYIDGESVMARLKRDGKLEAEAAVDIAITVGEALAHAANHRVVHQDVKPHNIMVDKRGNVKLTDLGLATITGREKHGAKKQKGVMGTPHYMAPEQSKQGKIDPRTDLYALGCTIFHMLTGRVPFEGPNSLVILTKHVINERPDPREFDVTIPDDLADLVMEMMAIDMDERPAGPKDVVERLKAIKTSILKGEAEGEGKKKGAGVVRRRAMLKRPAARILPAKSGGPAIAVSEDYDGPEELTETATSREPREPVRSRRTRGRREQLRTVALFGLFLLVAWVTFRMIPSGGEGGNKGKRPYVPPTDNGASADPAAKTDAPPSKTLAAKSEPAGKTVAAKTEAADPPEGPAPIDPEALAELQKAMDARDRALVTGNFTGARQALTRYLSNRMTGPAAERARKELRDTETTIEETISQTLKEAQEAADKRNYRAAAYKCTKLLAADPGGRGAREAQALMNRIDTESEPRFGAVKLGADQALEKGRLDEALKALDKGLTDLGGTKWADQIAARQFQVVLAAQFLKRLEKLRGELAGAGKPPEVMVTDLKGKKVAARLKKVDGLALEVELGGTGFPHSFTKLEPNEIYDLIDTGMGLLKDHLGKANLFVVLGQEEFARKEAERAMKEPEQAEEAARMAARLSGVSNLHVYDFAKWQQVMDWDSPFGAWSTKNDQYVLESPEGGDSFLKTDAIGGPLEAKGARIGFEFTRPAVTSEGWFLALEYGTEQRNISVIFNAEGVALQANVNEMKSEKGAWKPGATRVELALDENDKVTLTVNGQPGPSLSAAGASALRGGIGFRIREATCAFDNIILRNVKE
ncbi:MAG: protein kinase [Planctomycetota bacterium]|nr:protein kinase [Planctomycetota bacterium]